MRNTFLVSINNNTYCGKCGKFIFNDYRDIKKHEKECSIKINHEAKELEDIKAYYLEAKNESLVLYIVQATGNKENFKGIIWKNIYSCEFFKYKKVYKESGKENLNYWIEMFELNMLFDELYDLEMLNIGKEKSFITINKVFPGIGYIDRIDNFIKRFLTKGFVIKHFNMSDIRKLPTLKIDLNIGKKYRNNLPIYFCQLKEVEINDDIMFLCACIKGRMNEGKIIVEEKNILYISHNYVYNPNNFDILDFINKDVIYGRFRYDKYSKKYPETMLREYIESGGERYLHFIISENNDFLMELIGKASLGYVSNKINEYRNINPEATNIKQIFGLPIKALRNINTKEVSENLNKYELEIFKKAYKIQPSIFNEPITETEILFLNSVIGKKGNLITACKNNPKDILDYSRYCRTLNQTEYNLFVDYSNMCNTHKLWPYKKFPEKQNLKLAHDVIMQYSYEKKKAEESHNFDEAISNEIYREFIELPFEQFYLNSRFTLLMPRSADDLVEESYQMRNCVRSYIPSVSAGRTYILFLRKKTSKSSSFVTIEVNRNRALVQVKGKGNSHPDDQTKEYVIHWCKDKCIDYEDCWDLKEHKYRYY